MNQGPYCAKCADMLSMSDAEGLAQPFIRGGEVNQMYSFQTTQVILIPETLFLKKKSKHTVWKHLR